MHIINDYYHPWAHDSLRPLHNHLVSNDREGVRSIIYYTLSSIVLSFYILVSATLKFFFDIPCNLSLNGLSNIFKDWIFQVSFSLSVAILVPFFVLFKMPLFTRESENIVHEHIVRVCYDKIINAALEIEREWQNLCLQAADRASKVFPHEEEHRIINAIRGLVGSQFYSLQLTKLDYLIFTYSDPFIRSFDVVEAFDTDAIEEPLFDEGGYLKVSFRDDSSVSNEILEECETLIKRDDVFLGISNDVKCLRDKFFENNQSIIDGVNIRECDYLLFKDIRNLCDKKGFVNLGVDASRNLFILS